MATPKCLDTLNKVLDVVNENGMKLMFNSGINPFGEDFTPEDVDRKFPKMLPKWKAAWKSFCPWMRDRMAIFKKIVSAALADTESSSSEFERAEDLDKIQDCTAWEMIENEVADGSVPPSLCSLQFIPELVEEIEDAISALSKYA